MFTSKILTIQPAEFLTLPPTPMNLSHAKTMDLFNSHPEIFCCIEANHNPLENHMNDTTHCEGSKEVICSQENSAQNDKTNAVAEKEAHKNSALLPDLTTSKNQTCKAETTINEATAHTGGLRRQLRSNTTKATNATQNTEETPTKIPRRSTQSTPVLSQVFPKPTSPSIDRLSTSWSSDSDLSPKLAKNFIKKEQRKTTKKQNTKKLYEKNYLKNLSSAKNKLIFKDSANQSQLRRSQRERKETTMHPYAIEIFTRAYFPEEFKNLKAKEVTKKTKNAAVQRSVNTSIVSWLESAAALKDAKNDEISTASISHRPDDNNDERFLSGELMEYENSNDLEFRYYSNDKNLGYLIFKPKSVKEWFTLNNDCVMRFVCMSGQFQFKLKVQNSSDIKEYHFTIADFIEVRKGDAYTIENLCETEQGQIMVMKEKN